MKRVQSWGRRENGIKRSCHLAILHRYSLNHIVQLPSHNPRPQVTISKKIQSTIICYVTWHIIRILLYKQQKLTVDYLIGKVTHGYLRKLLGRLEIKLQKWNIWQPEPQLNIHTTSLVRRQLPTPSPDATRPLGLTAAGYNLLHLHHGYVGNRRGNGESKDTAFSGSQ